MDTGAKKLWEPVNEYKEKSTMNQFLNYVNTNNHTNIKEIWAMCRPVCHSVVNSM